MSFCLLSHCNYVGLVIKRYFINNEREKRIFMKTRLSPSAKSVIITNGKSRFFLQSENFIFFNYHIIMFSMQWTKDWWEIEWYINSCCTRCKQKLVCSRCVWKSFLIWGITFTFSHVIKYKTRIIQKWLAFVEQTNHRLINSILSYSSRLLTAAQSMRKVSI